MKRFTCIKVAHSFIELPPAADKENVNPFHLAVIPLVLALVVLLQTRVAARRNKRD